MKMKTPQAQYPTNMNSFGYLIVNIDGKRVLYLWTQHHESCGYVACNNREKTMLSCRRVQTMTIGYKRPHSINSNSIFQLRFMNYYKMESKLKKQRKKLCKGNRLSITIRKEIGNRFDWFQWSDSVYNNIFCISGFDGFSFAHTSSRHCSSFHYLFFTIRDNSIWRYQRKMPWKVIANVN